jgi:hypothetical protein
VLFLAGWIVGGLRQGHNQFIKDVCSIRKAKVMPTSIDLVNGKKLTGKVFDRSEKFTVFIDTAFLYVITAGEKPTLIDTTTLPPVECTQKGSGP